MSGLLASGHRGEGTLGTPSLAGFLPGGHPALAMFPVEIRRLSSSLR